MDPKELAERLMRWEVAYYAAVRDEECTDERLRFLKKHFLYDNRKTQEYLSRMEREGHIEGPLYRVKSFTQEAKEAGLPT